MLGQSQHYSSSVLIFFSPSALLLFRTSELLTFFTSMINLPAPFFSWTFQTYLEGVSFYMSI
jgi:hypothetical protein